MSLTAVCRIQEGMIFVSMTSDELLARTAQYQIQYSPARRRPSRSRRNGTRPSQEYPNSSRSPLQSLERTVLADPDLYSDSEIDSTTLVFQAVGTQRPNSESPQNMTISLKMAVTRMKKVMGSTLAVQRCKGCL